MTLVAPASAPPLLSVVSCYVSRYMSRYRLGAGFGPLEGTLRTNAGRLAGELGMHAAKVRRDLAALRGCGYIRYNRAGRRELYVISIEKYDRHVIGLRAGRAPAGRPDGGTAQQR